MSDTIRQTGEGPAEPAPEKPDGMIGIRAGETIAEKYEIISKLGSGGFGAVFLARHKTIGKQVAIKILRRELAEDPQQTARFLQEARAANEVTHRNIVEVMDFGVHDGRPYMVMAYLRGESLSDLIKREGRLAPARAIRIISPVLKALSVAHARGVIHRDIKPDNIFLASDEDGDEPTPKILDFGIAKRVAPDDVRLTDTRAAFGTPLYMAPEQALGARDATAAADQYAIGVVLYEALSGRLPHHADTYNAIIVAKVTRPAEDIAKLCPDLDPALAKVVMRALSREPGDRFPSVSALREALEPFAGITRVTSEPSLPPRLSVNDESALGATVPAATSDPQLRAQTPDAWTTATRQTGEPPRRRRAKFGGAVLVAAVSVLSYRAFRPQPSAGAGGAGGGSGSHAPTESVMYHLQFEPSNAEVTIDGVLAGHGAADVRRPRDGARHILRASAPGYVDLDETIDADSDHTIVRQLTPVPHNDPPQPVAATPDAARSGVTPAAPQPPPQQPEHHQQPASHPHPTNESPADPRHPEMDRNIRL